MVESLFFIEVGAGVGAGKKILGAGQKWTGSATLIVGMKYRRQNLPVEILENLINLNHEFYTNINEE